MSLLCQDGPGSHARVLIVDDDPMIRKLYSRFLRGAGFEVETVSSGSDALTELGAHAFDLVLLDHIMPQLTGLEMLEQLPGRSIAGAPRFVMLTGSNDEAVANRCKQLGADDVLIKPVPPAVLRETAKRAVAS